MRTRIRRFLGLQKVSRVVYFHRASVEHMCVDHGGVYISVPHQLLDRADILSTLQQMGSEGVTENMRRGGLMDAARQRLGHQHARPARRQVILMQVAHRELPPLEVQILHSQSQGLL
jgi:hypothetical protein